jgi:hypothetical protein
MLGISGPSLLELAVEKAIRDLNLHVIGSEDYVRTLDALVKLHKMKLEEKASSVKKDTLLIVGTNLLGLLMIIKHEHVNIITSRAFSLLLKPR